MKTRPARLLALTMLLVSSAWAAPKFKVLHNFGGESDGTGLWGSLTFDASGNLYGTTVSGGANGGGTVFELSPQSDGTWNETILHSFPASPDDGGAPTCAPVLDGSGNLYGTTVGGGGPYTYGVVFELTPGSDGWTETFPYRFRKGQEANGPYGGVIFDGPNRLYGVGGAAFELTQRNDEWDETILHVFSCLNGGGCGTLAEPALGADGNLYEPTQHGGTSQNCDRGCGTVYQLRHTGDGWRATIIHDFGVKQGDGELPGVGALFVDKSGALYGTTDGANARGSYGTVYRLAPAAGGKWKETVLHTFSTSGDDGQEPSAGVVGDSKGNLYGTTIAGGSSGDGVVYELSPRANGKWKVKLLRTFVGSDGAQPDANLILDSKGNLYGTTPGGGRLRRRRGLRTHALDCRQRLVAPVRVPILDASPGKTNALHSPPPQMFST